MNMSGFTPPNMNWDDTNLPTAWNKFHSYLPRHLAKGLREKTATVIVGGRKRKRYSQYLDSTMWKTNF